MRKGIAALVRDTEGALRAAGIGADDAASMALRHASSALRDGDLAAATRYARCARASLVLRGFFTRVLESRSHVLVA